MWWIVGVVVLVALFASYVTWTAARVDRLHLRAAAAWSALDAHLVRRATAADGLARALGLPHLRQVALAARDATPEDREPAENDLTRALRELPVPGVPPGPRSAARDTAGADGVGGGAAGGTVGGGAAGGDGAGGCATAEPVTIEYAEVVASSRQVALTRQVHNDLVRDALAVRRRRLVRLLRLARRHPRPRYFDVDDPMLDHATVIFTGHPPG